MVEFLTNSQKKYTPNQIIRNFKPADEFWLHVPNFGELTPFESAYNLLVFDYFKLNEIYDSDLKKQVFKKTNEYLILLDSLKNIKLQYLNSVYYESGFNIVGSESFTNENFDGKRFQVNYDIQQKGFYFGIGSVMPYHCNFGFCPKVINAVEFKQLNITKKYNLSSNSNRSYTQYLFFPMDETSALEIENNRSEIAILRIYTIKGIYSATYNDPDFISDYHGGTCKVNVVKGGNMRLLIYNKATDHIYFDKIYPALQTK
jgi:hypothetical protein